MTDGIKHMSGRVFTRSQLEADPATVWAEVTTADGINHELRPWLRMTAPPSLREHGLSLVRPGERVCRSWVLLLGVLPVDYDDIALEQIEPRHRSLERSTMVSQRLWEHERTVEPAPGGCTVTDRIRYQPRLPVPDLLLRRLYRAAFAHRHSRLLRRFGGGRYPVPNERAFLPRAAQRGRGSAKRCDRRVRPWCGLTRGLVSQKLPHY